MDDIPFLRPRSQSFEILSFETVFVPFYHQSVGTLDDEDNEMPVMSSGSSVNLLEEEEYFDVQHRGRLVSHLQAWNQYVSERLPKFFYRSRRTKSHLIKIKRGLEGFVLDIFIEKDANGHLVGKRETAPRRCLLDTGSELNFIAHEAAQGLGIMIKREFGQICSVGGRTECEGIMNLQWHFTHSCDPIRRKRHNHSATFHVLDPDTPPLFDCILGLPWIQENMALFLWIVLKQHMIPHNLN